MNQSNVQAMENFQFQEGGDLSLQWHPSRKKLVWRQQKGALFFLARWQGRGREYGLIGLSHPGVEDQRVRVRQMTPEVIRSFEDKRTGMGVEQALCDLSGWGLVVRDLRGLRVYRDPVGRLPLMWARIIDRKQGGQAGVVVGTRPKVVMGSRRPIRRSRLEAFLRGEQRQGRDDFFQGVQRIRAAEVLVADQTGKISFQNYWPGSSLTPLTGAMAAQRIADALTRPIEGAISRGGELISLSGGYDSTLLLVLSQELGGQPRSISMVAQGTTHFDERQTIEEVLADRQIRGEFFSIRGPQQWGAPEVHHQVVDFGPTFQAEAAYFQNFYSYVQQKCTREGKAPVLVTGLGSDQLFFVGPTEWAQDRIWQGHRPPAVGSWTSRAKRRMKGVAAKWGLSSIPYYAQGRSGPPWMKEKRRPWDLEPRLLYDRHRWMEQRVDYFRSWTWEYTTRLLERYRRSTGVFVELPFLHLDVLRVGLSLPPSILRAEARMKAPLRELLETRVPASFFKDRRIGCFDEVVWEGLGNYMRPKPQTLIEARWLGEYFDLDRQKLRTVLKTNLQESDIFRIRNNFALWQVMAAELWLRQWELSSDSYP